MWVQRGLRGRGLWARVCAVSDSEGPRLCPGRLGAGGPAGATLQVPGGDRLRAGGRCGEGASHRGSWDHPGAETHGQRPLGVTQNSVPLALQQLSAGMPGTHR